ncbi:bifunctional coenzyme A synthase-like [Colius striatus]|uniref:bifunctional coenzyme A synthase-like n=1 Tax=Colius striatus TaxID=57412 RepID=UPI002B1E72B0|nr:bifunctional coenzyme A synthase-like [Colius striatus]
MERETGEQVSKSKLQSVKKELSLYKILLMKDLEHSQDEEEKISSSSLQQRLLGMLLQPPQHNGSLPSHLYIISLTGGSGSGKTSIANLLGHLGTFLIDADKLGHSIYVPGGPAYEQVVAAFGVEILNEDGTINRKVLGAKVFGNQLAGQCDSPNTSRLSGLDPNEQLCLPSKEEWYRFVGKAICVLDAAVLLETVWQDMVHEVWTAIIPEEEVGYTPWPIAKAEFWFLSA